MSVPRACDYETSGKRRTVAADSSPYFCEYTYDDGTTIIFYFSTQLRLERFKELRHALREAITSRLTTRYGVRMDESQMFADLYNYRRVQYNDYFMQVFDDMGELTTISDANKWRAGIYIWQEEQAK